MLDVDDNDTRKKMEENLKSLDIPAYMENSRRGGHLWFFFDQPIEGRLAKNFGEEIARRMDITCEVFPKQEVSKGPGSCIRLPFGIHRKTDKRYDFENFNDFKTELKVMSHPSNRVNLDQVMSFQHEEIKSELKCYDNEPLWKKVKQAITVKELVENYVELNEHGVGKCPFHDDQTPSFSVNVEKNYWKCFRGCSGSSVIDFWMKLNKMEFSEAVKDLAERLRIQ